MKKIVSFLRLNLAWSNDQLIGLCVLSDFFLFVGRHNCNSKLRSYVACFFFLMYPNFFIIPFQQRIICGLESYLNSSLLYPISILFYFLAANQFYYEYYFDNSKHFVCSGISILFYESKLIDSRLSRLFLRSLYYPFKNLMAFIFGTYNQT